MVIFHFTQTIHLLGIAHLFIWGPLFYYLLKFEIKSERFNFKSVYGTWIGLVMTTVAISLVFDVRDIILVMMGKK